MSKFFLTNNVDIYKKVEKLVENSEYKKAFNYSRDGIYAISTRKLAVDNQNGVECDKGFAIVTGTMAWDNGLAVDEKVLKTIYKTYQEDIAEIRKNSIGNYCLSILKNDILFVFGEIAGFYNIYFFHENDEWLLSNSLFDMANALKGKLTINKYGLIESVVQDGNLLDDTCYNEIHRLSGFNYLKITKNTFDIVEEECHYPISQGNIEEKVKRYTTLLRDYGVKMSKAYGAPTISMTGGLDARMVLSCYLSADVKPHLYYGTGNSFLTNTFNEDRLIDKVFAEKYDLIFHDESWATPDPVDKYWNEYLNDFGFYYEIYGGSDSVIESIKNTPSSLFTYGYCGELLRNLPWIEQRKSNFFTLEEYVNDFYITDDIRKIVMNINEYYDFIWQKQIKICNYYHLDPNHIANEDIFYLSLERRKAADSLLLNFVNQLKYCCYTLGQYECLVACRVTKKEAQNSGFMVRCLDALYPSVLDVPVFSHCTMRKFYRETMSLNPQTKPLNPAQKAKKFLKKHFPAVVDVMKILLKRQNDWRFTNDELTYDYIKSLCLEYDNHFIDISKNENPRRLVKYLMKLYAIKHV